MGDSDTALGHHLDEVAVAQLIGEIPSDAENDDGAIKVAATEQGRRVRGRLIHATDYQPDSAFAPEPLWRGIGERPNVEGLDEEATAEVLLRVGALSGWLDASIQAAGAQEKAKDLLSESAALFEKLGGAERAAHARSDLALCYWREGAYDEARVLLTNAFEGLTGTVERAKVLLRLTTVEVWAGRYSDALMLLKEHAHVFDERLSNALRGGFHCNLALALKQLGDAERRPDYLSR